MHGSARWFLLASLGTAVVLLTGSGLISLLSDSVTSTGNQAESGTFGSHDVQAAISDNCAAASYSDGPIGAAVDADIDLSTTDPLPATSICVKNTGSIEGRLRMHFDNVSDVEVGDCSASEAAEDSTCEDGQDGELAGVLAIRLNSSCSFVSDIEPTPFQTYLGDILLTSFGVSPGGTCRIILTPSVSGAASNSVLAAAQTDRLTWDIVFTLSDYTPPAP